MFCQYIALQKLQFVFGTWINDLAVVHVGSLTTLFDLVLVVANTQKKHAFNTK